jgi:hypothetical protein
MFFQEITPDTSSYMIAGYAIFFGVSLIYLISLFIRSRNLRRDLETLEDLDKEQ